MTTSLLDGVLDRTILYSFDRSGFERHRRHFQRGDLEVDLRGRVCLVTGANSGIGYETARMLAERGATVWLLCRDPKRGAKAVRDLRRETKARHLHLGVLDVSSLEQIRSFVAGFAAAKVDVLIHNAGVLPAQRQESADGIELTLATNVVGPFLLTQLLLPRLRAAQNGRVLFVSSGGMYSQKLALHDCDWKQRPFDGVAAYAQTKRMQVVLVELLAEREPDDGVFFASMHPGWADTPAVQSSIPRFWYWMQNRLRTPAEGADTTVWLAAADRVLDRSGRFWFDRSEQDTHFLPFTSEDRRERQRLWRLCERLANHNAPREEG